MNTTVDTVNLAGLLELRAQQRPDVAGLHAQDGRSWTFAQVDRIAGGIAVRLREMGIGPGDRVALFLTNGPDIVFFLFGLWKVGAVPVTISSLYNTAELAQSVAKTDPALVLVDDRHVETVSALKTAVPVRSIYGSFGAISALSWGDEVQVRAVHVASEDEACILFTGGTTGMPKAVSVTHGGTRKSLRRLALVSTGSEQENTAPADARPNLIALPLFHSGGQHALLFAYFVGRPVVVWERFSVDLLAELTQRFGFDNFFLLPTMVYDIVHAQRELPLSGVKSVLVAGQAISWQLRREFEERYRVPILVNYGSTESGHIAGWTASDMKAGLWKPGSAGRVYPGVDLEIRDEAGTPQGVGAPGEVVVSSEMTNGYVDDAQASAELVQDGWLHTGDIGYVDEDGVLWLVGRKRDMIKCGGFQVWPQEIEDTLREHPQVRDVRVLGVPDDRLGEIPVAQVVRADAASDATSSDDADLAAALTAFTRDRLAHFKTPRRFEFVAELERSATGKISRASAGSRAPADRAPADRAPGDRAPGGSASSGGTGGHGPPPAVGSR